MEEFMLHVPVHGPLYLRWVYEERYLSYTHLNTAEKGTRPWFYIRGNFNEIPETPFLFLCESPWKCLEIDVTGYTLAYAGPPKTHCDIMYTPPPCVCRSDVRQYFEKFRDSYKYILRFFDIETSPEMYH